MEDSDHIPSSSLADAALTMARIVAFKWNPETGATEWQGSWHSMLGYPESSNPPTLEQLLERTDSADTEAARRVLDAQRSSPYFDTALRIHCPDRAMRRFRFRSELTDTGLLGAIEDVTRRENELEARQKRDASRRIEAETQARQARDALLEMRQHQDEIRRTEAANAEHRSRLADSLQVETLYQMTLSLAHDLHQPLAAIAAATGAALRIAGGLKPDIERIREMMNEAQGQAMRAGAMLDETREHIRKSGATGPTNGPSIDLNDLIEDVASLTRYEANLREIRLEVALSGRPLLVDGNRLQIEQVLINVLKNGLEAMSPATAGERLLLIESEGDGEGHAEIRILDNGPGISQQSAERMFDVFYTTRENGLGMGLAICRSIMLNHHGQVTGRNRPDGGACFTIRLPMSDPNPGETRDHDKNEP